MNTSSLKLKEKDELLKENWGYDLLSFTYALADILVEKDRGKKSSIISGINKVEKAKRNILFEYYNFLNEFPPGILLQWGKMKTKKEKDDYILKVFKLKPSFEMLDVYKAPLEHELDIVNKNIKGRFITNKNKIFSVWAKAMKYSWSDDIRLLNWFYQKLEKTSYGNEIKTGEKIKKEKKKLKNQCIYFMKKDPHLFDYLFEIYFSKPLQSKNNLHSIAFNENSIEISKFFRDHLFKDKTEFVGKKKVYSSTLVKYSTSKKSPLIIFPNEETFP